MTQMASNNKSTDQFTGLKLHNRSCMYNTYVPHIWFLCTI